MAERIDKLLIENADVASRAQAKRLIQAGAVDVIVEGKKIRVKKVSEKYPEDVSFVIDRDALPQFVSRAGEKLANAVDHWLHTVSDADPDLFANRRVIDIGQSTGGFTDFALQHGAAYVLGIEVGRDQLADTLKSDSRVETWEQVNARHLDTHRLLEKCPEGFDIAVMDVSFISQTQILPVLAKVIRKQGYLFSLVKPQFEVGRDGVGKNGLVRDASLYPQVKHKIVETLRELGFVIDAYTKSFPLGGDGNQEFFCIAKKLD